MARSNSIGNKLRKARESKNISVEQAHAATKIHSKVIEALEEDRLEDTLSATYVKAFLRNYAGYLGLDVKEIIREYYRTDDSLPEKESVLQAVPILLTRDQKVDKHAIVAVLVVAAWLLILGFTGTKIVKSYKSFVNARKAMPAAAVVVQVKEAPKSTPEKADKRLIPIPAGRTISLTIVTKDEVWLKVTRDGSVAFHKTLPKNSKETWQADKEIVLSEIGRPEALKLNVNGRDIDLTGKRLSKSILITREGIDIGPR